GHVSLPPEAERLLALRAAPLVERIRARHPAVAGALASASRFAPVDVVLVIAGLLAGFALSALDGTQRIQVLSLSLAALLSWNAVVYLLLAVQALRARGKPREPGALRLALARFPANVVSRIVARSRAFDVALAEALRRF